MYASRWAHPEMIHPASQLGQQDKQQEPLVVWLGLVHLPVPLSVVLSFAPHTLLDPPSSPPVPPQYDP